jgi:hypothetical protein
VTFVIIVDSFHIYSSSSSSSFFVAWEKSNIVKNQVSMDIMSVKGSLMLNEDTS